MSGEFYKLIIRMLHIHKGWHLTVIIFSEGGENGPWTKVLQKTLEDSRRQSDPLPLQEFPISPVEARFVKFELVSYYGHGGGLQYFDMKGILIIHIFINNIKMKFITFDDIS